MIFLLSWYIPSTQSRCEPSNVSHLAAGSLLLCALCSSGSSSIGSPGGCRSASSPSTSIKPPPLAGAAAASRRESLTSTLRANSPILSNVRPESTQEIGRLRPAVFERTRFSIFLHVGSVFDCPHPQGERKIQRNKNPVSLSISMSLPSNVVREGNLKYYKDIVVWFAHDSYFQDKSSQIPFILGELKRILYRMGKFISILDG